MEPENDDGNVEYKLKLINKSEERLGQLATQMRFRCAEGDGECIYNLGVEDCGNMVGITEDEYKETIDNINSIADKNDYLVTLLSEMSIKDDKKVYEVLIREKNNDKYIDIKVAIAGNVNAGKTTTLGRLTTGINDDGRGSARSSMFNFIHEVKTGRTSSVAHHIIGFDVEGKIVNYQGMSKLSWPEIVSKSKKIISFYDLAGHEKYIRTTVTGLTSSFPDVCVILVASNDGINAMTKEHIFLCVVLKIPFVIVISKIDMCIDRKNILEETIKGINKFLKLPGIRRISLNIKSRDDIMIGIKNIYNEGITPIFYISNVTGEGIDYLTTFFNLLKPRPKETSKEDLVEFHIDHIWSNVVGVGTVIGGHLINGTVHVKDKLLLGPGDTGVYEPIIIKSIKCKKITLQQVSCGGTYVCFGMGRADKSKIKKGNVVVSPGNELTVFKFVAKIDVLKTHSTTVKIGYEPTFHAYNVRQCVKLLNVQDKKNNRTTLIEDDVLRNADSALVTFQFKYKPEYLKVGTGFLLCEGKCKIIGEVVEIFQDKE